MTTFENPVTCDFVDAIATFQSRLNTLNDPAHETLRLGEWITRSILGYGDASSAAKATDDGTKTLYRRRKIDNMSAIATKMSLDSPLWSLLDHAASDRARFVDTAMRHRRRILIERVARFAGSTVNTDDDDVATTTLYDDDDDDDKTHTMCRDLVFLDKSVECEDDEPSTTTFPKERTAESAVPASRPRSFACEEQRAQVPKSRALRQRRHAIERAASEARIVAAAVRQSAERRRLVTLAQQQQRDRIARLKEALRADRELIDMHDDAERLRALIEISEDDARSQRLSVAVQLQINALEDEFEERTRRLRDEHRTRVLETQQREHDLRDATARLSDLDYLATATTRSLYTAYATLRDATYRDLVNNVKRVSQRCLQQESQTQELTRDWPLYLARRVRDGYERNTEKYREWSAYQLDDVDKYANAALRDGLSYPDVISSADVTRTYSTYRDERTRDALESKPSRYVDRTPAAANFQTQKDDDDERCAFAADRIRVMVLEAERLIAYLWRNGTKVRLRAILHTYKTGNPFNERRALTKSIDIDPAQNRDNSNVSSFAITAELPRIVDRFRLLPENLGRFIVCVFLARYESTFADPPPSCRLER